jgi:hypothetical protein
MQPRNNLKKKWKAFLGNLLQRQQFVFFYYGGHGFTRTENPESPSKPTSSNKVINKDIVFYILQTVFLTKDGEVEFNIPRLRGPISFICVLDACHVAGRNHHRKWIAPAVNQKGYLIAFATSEGDQLSVVFNLYYI